MALMRYLGGKSKWGKHIASLIRPWRKPGTLWLEPFCGALNVTRWVDDPRVALDSCQALITTLQAVQAGWEPPDLVSEETYALIKSKSDPYDPLTAFVMFGCSWGGKWGAGYARDNRGDNYALQSKRALLNKMSECKDVIIRRFDYRNIPVQPTGTLIYADPPYRCTTGYNAVEQFDSDEFWYHAYKWVTWGCLVFVSEGVLANAPNDWIVWNRFNVYSELHLTGASRVREERLYVHVDSPMGKAVKL